MDPARKSYNVPDAAFGYGPALKVGVGCIVRYTPESHFYYQYLQTLSPVAHERLNLPAEMPGPTHKQKIVRVFFHKRAIELQTAVPKKMGNSLWKGQVDLRFGILVRTTFVQLRNWNAVLNVM